MEMMLPDLTQSGAFFCLVPLVDGVRTPSVTSSGQSCSM